MKNIILLLLLIGTTATAQINVKNERKLDLGFDKMVLVENHLAVNPTNDMHLLLSGMYINPNDDADYNVFASQSFDGGLSWTKPFIVDEPEGADPWGVITKNGTALVTSLRISTGIDVYRLASGQKEWSRYSLEGEYFDHQTMAYDEANDRVFIISDRNNNIYYNYSSDDGKTFPNANEWRYNNLFMNTMNGQLASNQKLIIPFSNYSKLIYDEEKDKTVSSSLAKSLNYFVEVNPEDGSYGLPRLICDQCEKGFPVLAIDKSNSDFQGNMYYVCSSQTNNEVLFQYSVNQGKSWTEPKVISTYHNQPRTKKNPFTGMPQITVNNAGIIGIIWQDRTDDPDGLCNRLYFSASLDGGKTFLAPVAVSSSASCMEADINSWGGKRYKSGGDYTGMITNDNGDFVIIWPDSRNGLSQLYSAVVSVK